MVSGPHASGGVLCIACKGEWAPIRGIDWLIITELAPLKCSFCFLFCYLQEVSEGCGSEVRKCGQDSSAQGGTVNIYLMVSLQ